MNTTFNRPLSRRLDRCDRMIQNGSRDPGNGGNVCLFSAVTCMSQCKLRSLHANARLSESNLHCDVQVVTENKHTLPACGSLASLSIAMAFSR